MLNFGRVKYSLDISGYQIKQSWLDTRAGWDSKPGDLRRFLLENLSFFRVPVHF